MFNTILKGLMLAGVCGFVAGCDSRSEVSEVQKSKTALAVKISEVQSLQPSKSILLPGELKAWDRVDIYPKVRAFVKTVNADRGSIVKKGQPLVILEAPEIQSEMQHAYAQVQASHATMHENKARLNGSKAVYYRLQKASKTVGAISPNELDQAYAKFQSDSSAAIASMEQVNSAEANYISKKELVGYLTIRAPFDGIIMERNISPGALVGEGQPNKPLYVLENSAKLRLTLAIPEIYSNGIHPKSEVSFSVNSIPAKKFKAGYARSAQNIDNDKRVMMTEYDIDNKNYALKAGMYAEVEVPVTRTYQTLFVPLQALVNSSERVFVIRCNEKVAEWVDVKKGIVSDTLVEVFGDLKQGDKIISKASEEIRNGDKVSW